MLPGAWRPHPQKPLTFRSLACALPLRVLQKDPQKSGRAPTPLALSAAAHAEFIIVIS